MSTRKTFNEQITAAQEEMKQRENRLKQLLQKQKEQERRDRTKRLIERGAILESLIDNPAALTNEQVKTLLQTVLTAPAARQTLTALLTGNAAANSASGVTRED